MRGVKLLV